jgi:hypothetical protein
MCRRKRKNSLFFVYNILHVVCLNEETCNKAIIQLFFRRFLNRFSPASYQLDAVGCASFSPSYTDKWETKLDVFVFQKSFVIKNNIFFHIFVSTLCFTERNTTPGKKNDSNNKNNNKSKNVSAKILIMKIYYFVKGIHALPQNGR